MHRPDAGPSAGVFFLRRCLNGSASHGGGAFSCSFQLLYARTSARTSGSGADMQLCDGLELGYERLLQSSSETDAADHRVHLRFQSRF